MFKAALAKIMPGKNLIGVIATGFDTHHFNEIRLSIVLNKYRRNWLICPNYHKETQSATDGFAFVNKYYNSNGTRKISIEIERNYYRFYNPSIENPLSKAFTFEFFVPHAEDMTSSNNCSTVCKIGEISSDATYLVTGDTECTRRNNIAQILGDNLKADVLDAPHHDSKNSITEAAMKFISPRTILISAGVGNNYGHPDAESVSIFRKYSKNVYKTSGDKDGYSIETIIESNNSARSYKFNA